MDIQQFAELFLNEEMEYHTIVSVVKERTHSIVKEVYKHNRRFFQLEYVIYPTEDVFNIVLDREFSVMEVQAVVTTKTVIEWIAI